MGLAVREAKEVLMLEKGKGPWHKNIVIIKFLMNFFLGKEDEDKRR
jgi:hypothetical protein